VKSVKPVKTVKTPGTASVTGKAPDKSPAHGRKRLLWLLGGLVVLGVTYLALPASWYTVPDEKVPAAPGSGKTAAGTEPGPAGGAPVTLEQAQAAVASAPTDYVARSRYGFALASAGKPKEALAELKTAVRLAPESPAAHFNLGVLLLQNGRPAEADEAFCRLLEISPGDGNGHYHRGLALVQQQKREEAVRQFKLAAALSPDLPEPYSAMASELSSTQSPDATKTLVDEFVKRGGDEGLGNLIISRAYRDHKDYATSLSYAEKAVKVNPNSVILVRNLAEAYTNAGRWSDADSTLRKALPLTKKPAEVYAAIAANAEKAGRLPDAAEALRQALASDPNDLLLHKNLAEVYQRLGDTAAAQTEEEAYRKGAAGNGKNAATEKQGPADGPR
jgi:protein O-GlcNAc transferase